MNLSNSPTLPASRRFILLAPRDSVLPGAFHSAYRDTEEHRSYLEEAQRLRGRLYLADGAIEAWQLTSSGRHLHPADPPSFHLLSLDEVGRVAACTRYLPHLNTVTFSELGIYHSPPAGDPKSRIVLEEAVESELARARSLNYGYVEIGGWAVAEKLRCSMEAVRTVVAIYALGRMLGGALGISTVTTRHGSSSILRRLGGLSLTTGAEELPPYFDASYGCEMEILRFDSDRPSDMFEAAVRRCVEVLARTTVIAPDTLEVPSVCPYPRLYRESIGKLLSPVLVARAQTQTPTAPVL